MDSRPAACSSPEQLVNQWSAVVKRTRLVLTLRHPCDLLKLLLLKAVSLAHALLGWAQMEGEDEGGVSPLW